MWYRSRTGTTSKSEPIGYEEKIVRSCIDREIRKRLYLQGDYNPSASKMSALTKKALKKIEDEFGTFDNIRLSVSGENLSPAVVSVISQLMK